MDVTPAELMEIGERVFNVCRLFNLREGFSRKDDVLPGRLSEKLPRGAISESSITEEDLGRLLDEYYAFRGWTPEGVPTQEKLERLGIQ